MKCLGIEYFCQSKEANVLIFDTIEEANKWMEKEGKSDECGYIIKNKEDLSDLPLSALAAVYNSKSSKKIKKFSDKNTATERVWSELTKCPANDVEETESSARRNISRASKIHKLIKDNPRREHTYGHKSWELIKDVMTVSEYLKAGGRMKDLLWDLDFGDRIELKD